MTDGTATSTASVIPGLRERKKARTRALIQEHALRLFEEQGYAHTTVEQIAEAAEVSPSTFFRYFPNKEDTVAHNRFTPAFLDALRARPPGSDLLETIHRAVHDAAEGFDEQTWTQERRRQRLVLSVPDLRAASFEQLMLLASALRDEVARRAERDRDDLEVHTFTGALLGVFAAVVAGAPQTTARNYAERIDRGLAHLRSGVPL